MSKKIFVLDDEEVVVCLFRNLLRKAGYEVHTHTKSESALDEIMKFKPDLMILDLTMPVKDGYELIDDIRTVRSLNVIPILVVTACYDDYLLKKLEEARIQDYFNKPIVANEVLVKVRQLLS